MSLNKIIMIGNLTRDCEIRYSPQGVSVANTGIAVNRWSKNDSGDYEVDFFNCVAFRKTADYMSQYLRKGNRVAIEGRLQSRSWDDATTGLKRTVYEIIIDNIQNLTPRDLTGTPEEEVDRFADETPAANAPVASAPAKRAPAPPPVVEDTGDPWEDEEIDHAALSGTLPAPVYDAPPTQRPATRQPARV